MSYPGNKYVRHYRDVDWWPWENFTPAEVACPCCDELHYDHDFMESLQTLRNWCGRPMTVNSMYRCKKHNQAVGGSDKSYHLIGRAVDIHCTDDNELLEILLHNASLLHAQLRPFTGIGVYNTFVHLDQRGNPYSWLEKFSLFRDE